MVELTTQEITRYEYLKIRDELIKEYFEFDSFKEESIKKHTGSKDIDIHYELGKLNGHLERIKETIELFDKTFSLDIPFDYSINYIYEKNVVFPF